MKEKIILILSMFCLSTGFILLNAQSALAQGGKIAFVSYRDGNSQIYVMNADGSNPVRITENGASNDRPFWSNSFGSGPQTLTVTKTANTDDGVCNADCSLKEAITVANSTAADDTIVFAIPASDTGCEDGVCTIISDEFIVNPVETSGRLTITNATGENGLWVSGNGTRVFFINTGADLTLTGVTIAFGGGVGQTNPTLNGAGGGIYIDNGTLTLNNSRIYGNISQYGGGGIYNNRGTLTLNNSNVVGNVSRNDEGGGIVNYLGTTTLMNSKVVGNQAQYYGGGINNIGTLTLYNSYVGENWAEDYDGGGIVNSGYSITTLTNSTVAFNNARKGAGIYNSTNSELTLTNSTVSGNGAREEGGGIYNLGTLNLTNVTVADNFVDTSNNCQICAAGIYNEGSAVNLNNTIVARNYYYYDQSSTDFFGLVSANSSYNLIGNNRFLFGISNGVNGNQIGTPDNRIDPKLEFLDYNGGPTPTCALKPDSPAIDKGNNLLALDMDGNPLTTDQRGEGFTRIVDGNGDSTPTVDIGAFEFKFTTVDQTPPVITPNVSGTLGNNEWYTSDVTISWIVADDESTISNSSGCQTQTVSTDTNGTTFTCSAASAGGTTTQSVTVKRDATAPVISLVSRSAANANGWNNTDVEIEWSCGEAVSGAVSAAVNQTVSGEGQNQSVVGVCEDNAGNIASDTQSGINIDKTAPELNPSVSPNPVPLNGSATAAANASDSLSGVDSQSCAAVDTSSGGSKTVSCTASDKAGNISNAEAHYTVGYNFAGFFQPVENFPAVNTATAGSAIPLKFSLSGNQGLAIFAPGYPASGTIPCGGTNSLAAIEEIISPGASALSYDAATDRYTYVWKTNKSWKGECRQLIIKLNDGSVHIANFKFK